VTGASARLSGERDRDVLSTELELKFAVSEADLTALSAHPALAGPRTEACLISSYFDTPLRALERAGLSLRLRREDGAWVQTLKGGYAPGDLARLEWRHRLVEPGRRPGRARRPQPLRMALADTPAAPLIRGQRLRSVFTIDVTRAVQRYREDGAIIEVALDRGVLKAGPLKEPILELELERLSGDSAALFTLARSLANLAPLWPRLVSKADRGYALAAAAARTGPSRRPARREWKALSQDPPTLEAFGAIAHHALAETTERLLDLRARRGADTLHQMRVSLRRLDAALQLFGPAVRDGEWAHVRAAGRDLAQRLDAVREMHVFLRQVSRGCGPGLRRSEEARAARESRAALLRAIRRMRAAALDEALASFDAPGASKGVMAILSWLDDAAWTRTHDATRRARQALALSAFIAPRLQRLRRRVLAVGDKLEGLSPSARHKLRLKVKRLRYAAIDASAPFHRPGRTRRFLKALTQVQDALGDLNDLAATPKLAHAAAREAGTEGCFLAGRLAAEAIAREPAALRRAARAIRRLKHAEPFWV
jgi:inorganic triphosphatase YgiF